VAAAAIAMVEDVTIATVGTMLQMRYQESLRAKHRPVENDIFDSTGPHDAANFHRLLKHIADHLQLIHGNDLSEVIWTIMPIYITIPPAPIPQPDPNNAKGPPFPVSEIDTHLRKEKHKKAMAKLDKYQENMACVYIMIFHQCMPSLINKVEASDTFPKIQTQQDSIALLKLIQSLCCPYNSKTQSIMAIVASHKCLLTYYQHNGVNNHQYYQEFCACIKTNET
jgi:hypothetical protein